MKKLFIYYLFFSYFCSFYPRHSHLVNLSKSVNMYESILKSDHGKPTDCLKHWMTDKKGTSFIKVSYYN